MKRKILIAVFSIAIVFSSVFIYCSNNYTEKGIDKYNKKVNSNSDLINFSLKELGSYKDIYFQSHKTGYLLFTSYGSLIVADYNNSEFEEQMIYLDKLKYQTETILFDESNYILPETEFQIGDWQFKVLENKSLNYSIPKSIDFIAVNKSELSIAYLTFYDQDIDYLCEASERDGYMERFINKYFKYDFR